MRVIDAQIEMIRYATRKIARGEMKESALDVLFENLITGANIYCLNDDISPEGYARVMQQLKSLEVENEGRD